MAEWVETPESSHVEAIRYEPDTHDLYVRFSDDGSVYQYMDVPIDVHRQLMESGSKGRFVNIVLRRRYRYLKVE
jgi:KTSC domain